MKLYKEEQLKDIMSKVFAEGVCFGASPLVRNKPFDDILKDFNPIQLPSDEEIIQQTQNFMFESNKELFYNGAKWVIEQLKQEKK